MWSDTRVTAAAHTTSRGKAEVVAACGRPDASVGRADKFRKTDGEAFRGPIEPQPYDCESLRYMAGIV